MISLDGSRTPLTPKNRRHRKVYYAFYDYRRGLPHPVIRLAGKYLEAFDFKVGDQVEVHLEPGKIIISKVSNTVGK